ncbi:MAG: hypothetical protein ABFC56_01075 [Clostridiaceae bacterium]
MKAKRILSLLLSLAIMCSVAAGFGCGTPAGTTTESAGTTDVATEDPNAPDYDNMSMKELYDLAIQEEGGITIYSTTTTAQTAVKKFLKSYPEFEGRIEYIESDTNTVADRIETESDTGNINADLLQVKDNSGEIFYELVNYDYLDIYYPASVCAHIDPDLLTYGMPIYATYSPWYYSTRDYPDGCPLKSWWDIVQGYDPSTLSYTDASGKNNQFWTIYTKDITSASYAALWAQLIVDGDAMTAQYEAQYGKPLEFTYMKALKNNAGMMEFPENNGGVELFWRFTQMMITELDDGDQVVAAVDESLNGPTLGLCSGSKLDNVNNGAQINWVTGLQPYTAFKACDYVYPIKDCDNPAGARLFILYMLGGEDGQSGCYAAFNSIGKWSIRDDFVFDKTPYSAEEVNLKNPDFADIYSFYPDVKAYWIYWRELSPTT